MIKDFAVKGEIREFLKKPIGKLISESEFSKLKLPNLITVGDIVSETAIRHGFKPELIIFDNKVKRKPVDKAISKILKKYNPLSFKCKNPAGVLSLDSWKTVENALSDQSPARIEVTGEEDLLALACLFLAPEGYNLVYGQPDKGIVLVKITEQLKQQYIFKISASLGQTFMQNLSGKTVIVHDSDTDGCTSGAIFTYYLRQKGLEAIPLVTRDAVIHDNVQRQIAKLQPDNLIILDLGVEAHEYIRSKSRHMKIMVVDHHHLRENTDFGRALIINPHLFNIPEILNPATAHLSYIICQVLDWASALGSIADKAHPSCQEFLKKTSKKYNADFEIIKNYTNAADVLRNSEYIVTAILQAKKPQDLMKNAKLVAYEKEFSTEVDRLLQMHKEKAHFYKDAKLVVYDIETKYSLRGGISNKLQQLYKGWTVIIGEEQGKSYAMSLRTSSDSVNLVKTIASAISKLRNATGGGHAKASGCKVLLKDRERFIETFIKLVKESSI
jgi:hypothetical protein|tara:strand:+ start:1476 stop:2975 length:1500 start_codon:yes stop_codon:yes gene_type:complete